MVVGCFVVSRLLCLCFVLSCLTEGEGESEKEAEGEGGTEGEGGDEEEPAPTAGTAIKRPYMYIYPAIALWNFSSTYFVLFIAAVVN